MMIPHVLRSPRALRVHSSSPAHPSPPGSLVTPLRGSDALDWLRERGIVAEGDGSFALAAEEVELPGLVLRRIWHTPATLRRDPAPRHASVLLLAPLEGAFSVSAASDHSGIIAPGRFAALPGGLRSVITTRAAGARLELLARPTPSAGADERTTLLVAASVALPALTAAANAILGSGPRSDGRASSRLADALEDLLGAVLASAVDG